MEIRVKIDFAAHGPTGSHRYKPRTKEKLAERKVKAREAGRRYRDRHRERERARWRKVAARSRAGG